MDTNQVIRVTNDWSTEMRKYYLNATRQDHTQSGPWVQLIINKDSSRDNFVEKVLFVRNKIKFYGLLLINESRGSFPDS